MGGTLSALFTALSPERVRTLTLLAAPIDFRGRETLLNLWTDRKCFDVDAFVEANGNCPAWFLQLWFLQLCFLYTKPIQNLVEKNLTFYEQMDDARFVSNYLAMERWVNDNIPIAGETFREFVKKLYQEKPAGPWRAAPRGAPRRSRPYRLPASALDGQKRPPRVPRLDEPHQRLRQLARGQADDD